eukprot:TRINITY_DN5642_c0_g1_i2.p1 TRINITY_DN5642_c0_g1~~TRINITY_DN5642_c0_g1_i2.p1  ORF type:complete len:226 (+),score=58.48 TRINITY_DN5642_c0_g1_i2:129-806(+)
MVKGYGAKVGSATGRRYSVITPKGEDAAVGVRGFKGKCLCIVFYPMKEKFTLGVKAFAAAQEKFNKEDCVVIACTADSNWSTWSTSLGLTLKGEMTAASLAKIKEEAFIPDPTSYDIPTVSLVMLDECSCIRHVMSTSLEPEDAVEAALSAAITMNTCRLPDPESLRKTTRERNFGKQKYDVFKRKSFYDLGLNTEQGQITLLGESELSAQCHLNFGTMLEATSY